MGASFASLTDVDLGLELRFRQPGAACCSVHREAVCVVASGVKLLGEGC